MDNKRKNIIIIVSVALAVLIIAAAVVGSLLFGIGNNADNPSDTDSSSVNEEGGNTSETPEAPVISEVRPKTVTKTYEIVQEFSIPKFEQEIYFDSKTGKPLPYSIILPEGYSKSKKYPVLFFLHGAGERGNNPALVSRDLTFLFRLNGDLVRNAIILCPQCPTDGWWNIDESTYGDESGWLGCAMRLLKEVESTYSCDLNRIYVTGLSMGGYGTWSLLERYSDHFAAGVPICGWGDTSKGSVLKNIPIWIYHGTDDSTVSISSSQAMYDAVRAAGGYKIRFTKVPETDHNSWDPAYSDRELISWMFAQNKASNPDATYEYCPYFKVCDSEGKTVISDKDLMNISYERHEDSFVKLKMQLTYPAAANLKAAYAKNIGNEFTAYYGNQKVFDFKVTGEPTDNFFVIDRVLTKSNISGIYNKLKNLIPEYE